MRNLLFILPLLLTANLKMYPLSHNIGFNKESSDQKEIYREIEFENTYRNNITGKDAVVAIIDSGCEISHEDLKDNIIFTHNVITNDSNVNDIAGHGTKVAGIIAASDNNVGIYGIAPDAKLCIFKVMQDGNDYFTYEDVITAINKAVDLGYVDVLNLSLSGTYNSDELKEALNRAREHGILVVCAAGNKSTSTPVFPAAYQIGLSVGSEYKGNITDYSNYGINANIFAPSNLLSTDKSNSYWYMAGTSASTPLVSGVAALIYGENPNMPRTAATADYVKNLIIDNTKSGVINVQNIFKASKKKSAKAPKIVITENKQTNQQIITVKSSKNVDIYYAISGDYRMYKLNKKLRLDKKGTYKISFIATKKNTKAYSNVVREKITVSSNVISQETLKSISLSGKEKVKPGKTYKIKISTSGKKVKPERIIWTSSNPNLVKVNDGIIEISSKAPKEKKVNIIAKIGNVKRVFTVKVK